MSNEELARRIISKVELMLLTQLPKPTCASKQAQWEWDIKEVKKKVAMKLCTQGMGIKIEI